MSLSQPRVVNGKTTPRLPSQYSKLGRVLRAMVSTASVQGGSMSAGHVRRKAGLAADTAVTARIRDLRKMGCVVACYRLRNLDGGYVYYYRVEHVPQWIIEALRQEAAEQRASGGRQGVAA